jgi:hypothetical protein
VTTTGASTTGTTTAAGTTEGAAATTEGATTVAATTGAVAVSAETTTSGTTTAPTSVTTTTVCQKSMAEVGGAYVQSVTYSVSPVAGTKDSDLTDKNSNGVTLEQAPNADGVLNEGKEPIYTITLRFNEPGVDSVGSIALGEKTNVDKFAVQFIEAGSNQPVTVAPNQPLYINSNIQNSVATISDFPSQVPTPLSAVRIVVLSTKDNK